MTPNIKKLLNGRYLELWKMQLFIVINFKLFFWTSVYNNRIDYGDLILDWNKIFIFSRCKLLLYLSENGEY